MATGEEPPTASPAQQSNPARGWWKRLRGSNAPETPAITTSQSPYRPRRTLGILSDKETDEVPGTLQLWERSFALLVEYDLANIDMGI